MCALKNFAPLTKIIDMKKIVFILAFVALLAGCKKSEPLADCEVNKTGSIKVVNSSANPYRLYVDGTFYGNVPGNANFTIETIGAGAGKFVFVEQISGYLVFPSTFQNSLTVNQCTTSEFYFP